MTGNSSDSDDDIPLAKRIAPAEPAPTAAVNGTKTLKLESDSDSEDDVPLSKRAAPSDKKATIVTPKPPAKKLKKEVSESESDSSSSSDDDVPLSKRVVATPKKPVVEKKAAVSVKKETKPTPAKKPEKKTPVKEEKKTPAKKTKKVDSSSEDDVPLARRVEKQPPSTPTRKVKVKGEIVPEVAEHIRQWWLEDSDEENEIKWTTLEHNGVWFPPNYAPHGVKILYDGKPVALTPTQEEAATFYAVMLESEYTKNPTFNQNFFHDWKRLLGKDHVIKELAKCDFTPIFNYMNEQKEMKKKATTEEKKAKKEEAKKLDDKFGWAMVDGHKEKVGNFRMELPGLFRGRGAHPKQGQLKRRIMPEDVTLNLGEDAKVPPCPIPGHKWGHIIHNPKVQWLAMFKDTINNHIKYVWFSNSSSFKGKSDKKKFEKARELKDHVDDIRENYQRKMKSDNLKEAQLATATAIIDKLALRVGNEKKEDEADTVGCCSLRAEHIKLIDPNKVEFDFLGKDSIRYFNTVEVETLIYKNLKKFHKAASADKGEQKIFSEIDTTDLNQYLKDFMPGLTAKVFRTYNASITLQRELVATPKHGTLEEKLAFYGAANRQVAILCNHQRSVSKTFDSQMEKLKLRLEGLKDKKKRLKEHLDVLEGKRSEKKTPAKKKKETKGSDDDEEDKEEKLPTTAEATRTRIEKVKEMMRRLEFQAKEKDDNKTVALGTSKINYLDPRITVAWCKTHKVPVQKIFSKTLVEKFPWAMAVDDDFEF